ncbi:uncharacterized protein LOC112048812 isoform X2 [Bicyclus anynana]|uniref:Uncharacterized protein LOC112048812 isoform X2 n=1 Tax=Bicyclus anynana TaxID=110368 RepID=A0A6J1N306_BICAN|nr:uncharacterized protein LOC112048812 isoform X2 [Bicyclus anynana]
MDAPSNSTAPEPRKVGVSTEGAPIETSCTSSIEESMDEPSDSTAPEPRKVGVSTEGAPIKIRSSLENEETMNEPFNSTAPEPECIDDNQMPVIRNLDDLIRHVEKMTTETCACRSSLQKEETMDEPSNSTTRKLILVSAWPAGAPPIETSCRSPIEEEESMNEPFDSTAPGPECMDDSPLPVIRNLDDLIHHLQKECRPRTPENTLAKVDDATGSEAASEVLPPHEPQEEEEEEESDTADTKACGLSDCDLI